MPFELGSLLPEGVYGHYADYCSLTGAAAPGAYWRLNFTSISFTSLPFITRYASRV